MSILLCNRRSITNVLSSRLVRLVSVNLVLSLALTTSPLAAQQPAAAGSSASKTAPVSAPPASAPEHYGTPFDQVPNPRDAVIYQVNIRNFSATGNFAGVKARLDAIQALGVNVLYLLPIYPIGQLKSVNSPYCVRDYTGINPEFGTLADLRSLVEEAHKRKMAVILDWVADHTSWDCAWIAHPNWYSQDASGNIISPPNTDWHDVAKLDFHNMDMHKAMIQAMEYWIYQANVDGYRCDAADFVPSDFWLQAIDDLRSIPSHKLLMLAEGYRKDLFTAGFQLKYGTVFYNNLVDDIYGKNASVRSIDAINIGEYLNATCDDRAVRFVTNHDLDMAGTPLELFGGKDGSLAAFVVAAYMKGVPLVYDGQEVGCPIRLNFLKTEDHIDWTANPDLVKTYQTILAIHNRSEAIRWGDLQSFSTDDVCAFTKTFKTAQALIIVNLRNAAESFTLPSTLAGTSWTNSVSGAQTTLPGQMNLQPYQYQIYETVNKDLLAEAMNTAVALSPLDSAATHSALSVPGAYEGWDPGKAPVLRPLSGSTGVLEGYVNFSGDGQQSFRFTNAPDWNHVTYSEGGNQTLSTSSKSNLSVPGSGYYELSADLASNKWTATKTTWGIIGDCTPGGWQTDTPMTYDPAKQVWTARVAMTTAGSFKFRANQAWSIDFGVDQGGNLAYADNPLLPFNPMIKNMNVAADGVYVITLDLHDSGKYTYSAVLKP